MNFFREVIDRRVLPAAGVYVGASWVLVEMLDRLVERYFLSPFITDIVFWGLLSLLPAVLLLAWTHGRPGKDKVTRLEKYGIPIYVLAAGVTLVTAFGSKDLSATAELVTLPNELGVEESHYIPRESYRRRIAVFFWDAEGLAPEQEWLRYGVTELLTQDLQQNPFLLVTSPWNGWAGGFYSEMKEAGFDDGLDVPLALKQDIADQFNRDYFIDGTIGRADQQFTATARVWDTETLEMIDEISASGWDLMTVVDDLSDGVRELLDTPQGQGDLPLAETYGESQDALEAYIRGRNAVLFENDREKANQLYDLALQADKNFVLAWSVKAISLWQQGDAAMAIEALEEAQKLSYRLPERDRVRLKMAAYQMSGDSEKLETLLRMQTRIVGDAASYRDLGFYLMTAGELEDAKAQFKKQMEVDSSSFGVLLQLARLERATGDLDAAIAYALEYTETEPEDLEPQILLGDLYLESGDMESARAYYERAQVIEDPPMRSTLKLALLSIKQGEWNRTRELLAEAREFSTTAQHAMSVLQVETYLESRLGRIERAIELTEEHLTFARQVQSPVEQVFGYNFPMIQFKVLLGRLDEAESLLLNAQQAVQPPMNQFLAFSEVMVFARKGDIERASTALESARSVIEHFQADYLAFMLSLSAAEIANATGDYTAAGEHYKDAIAEANRSVFAAGLQEEQSIIYAACADAHIKAGELDLAQSVLDYAFKRDSAEPDLWVARAMLQEATGAPHMALASVNYALAIWAEADPDYVHFQEALDLKQRLQASSR